MTAYTFDAGLVERKAAVIRADLASGPTTARSLSSLLGSSMDLTRAALDSLIDAGECVRVNLADGVGYDLAKTRSAMTRTPPTTEVSG